MNRDYIELVRQIEAQRGEIERLKTLESPRLNSVINDFLLIPGLVGFWPMSSVQRSTGNAYDVSGQGRVLSYNGNPTYNIHNNLAPYIDFDGTGDYLSRADETDLDILGTETIYAAAVRGLTLGAWLNPQVLPGAGRADIIAKWEDTTPDRSYRLSIDSTGAFQFLISDDGTNSDITMSAVQTVNSWYFVVGRFEPSAFVEVCVNGVWTQQATARASVNNGATAFTIGARSDGGREYEGYASLCFLSANALPDALIEYLYQRSKPLFI